MNYDDIHPVLRAVMGSREGFRKLGFSADDLYIEVARHPHLPVGALMVFTTLKTPRGKVFRIDAGPWPANAVEDLQREWLSLCDAVNGHRVPQPDMDRIWQESAVFKDPVGFVVRLHAKGIVPPKDWS